MPKITHDFSGGKMNKDLDERIVPNGQYRNAMNIQVRTTSGDGGGLGDAGVVQNLQGNKKILESIHYEYPYEGSGTNETKIIGNVGNEKNNRAYFFVASPKIDEMLGAEDISTTITTLAESATPSSARRKFIDYIVEVNTGEGVESPTCIPVVVDKWAIIDHALNVLDEIPTSVDGSWMQFDVLDSTDYRVGMTITAYDAQGEPVDFGVNEAGEVIDIIGEIQSINGSTIKLYEQIPENEAAWNNIVFLKFQAPRVLKLNKDTKLTAINIIDDLLFWTDGENEPRKINITRCKEGSPNYTSHTQVYLSDPLDNDSLFNFTGDAPNLEDSLTPAVNNDLKEDNIVVIRKAPVTAPVIEMKESDRETDTDVLNFFGNFASWDEEATGSTGQGPIQAGDVITVPNQQWINQATDFVGDYNAGPNIVDIDNPNGTNPDVTILNPYPIGDATAFNGIDYRVNDVLVFKEQAGGGTVWFMATIDAISDPGAAFTVLTLRVLSTSSNFPSLVFSEAITEAYGQQIPVIDGRGYWDISLEQRDPLFELVFGRFGLRYRYEDNEYSAFGPWSELVFLPGHFDYDHKKGYNLGMTNNIRSLTVKNFIPHQREKDSDIKAVDILFKKTNDGNVYVVKTISRGRDPEWDLFTTQPNMNANHAFGEMEITSELLRNSLPPNSILRHWDNVPSLAHAQEVAANRIIYGNYEQGYEIKNQVGLIQSLISEPTPTPIAPQKSVKTLRDYKFGMVFGDKYGRETPVMTPGYLTGNAPDNYKIISGDISVKKSFASLKNSFELKQNWDSISGAGGDPDSWISYVKYFVKETAVHGETGYYNMVMDRWYDAEERPSGQVWLTFASADINKVTEESYLILKNEHGNNRPVIEKGRYKIIAIENEAPDFIKTVNKVLGRVKLGPYSWDYMWNQIDDYTCTDYPSNCQQQSDMVNVYSPTKLMAATEIVIHEDDWDSFMKGYEPEGHLEVRVAARVVNPSSGFESASVWSDVWRQLTYSGATDDDDTNEEEENALIRWDKPFGESADMYDRLNTEPSLENIHYYLEFREVIIKNKPEFDGKFFVKVQKDDTLRNKVLFESGESNDFDPTKNYDLAYIDNQEYNPSTGSYDPDPEMNQLRTDYQWHSVDEDAVGDGGGYIGVSQDNTETSYDSTVANIIDDSSYPLASWYCRATNGTGCKPLDAEYLALGCSDIDGYSGSGAWAGYGDVQTSNNVYNRGRETREFWSWWAQTADFLDTDVFIDGMRSRRTQSRNSATPALPISFGLIDGGFDQQYSGTGVTSDTLIAQLATNSSDWIESDGSILGEDGTGYEYDISESPDPPNIQYLNDDPGTYWKPTGIDEGVASGETFNPTTPGELGRMMISTIRASFWENDNMSELRGALTQHGTYFRFAGDPMKTVYMVVNDGSTLNEFVMWNYSSHQDYEIINGLVGIDGWEGSSNDFFWGVDGSEHAKWEGANDGGPDSNGEMPFNWNKWNKPTDSSGNSAAAEVSHRIGYSNVNPKPPSFNGDGDATNFDQYAFVRIGGGWVGGSGDGGDADNYTDSGHVGMRGSGVFNDKMPIHPWQDFYNFDEEGGNIDAPYHNKFKKCGVCNEVGMTADAGTGGYWTSGSNLDRYCKRRGFRFEFRRVNPTGGLGEGENGVGSRGVDTEVWDPRGSVCHDGREKLKIDILSKGVTSGEIVIPVQDAAIWETEPNQTMHKFEVYYEASNAIPMRLNSENTTSFVPYNSKVKLKSFAGGGYRTKSFNNNITQDTVGYSLDDTQSVFHVGYTRTHSIVGIKSIQKIDDDSDADTPTVYDDTPRLQRNIGASYQPETADFLVFVHPDGTKTMSQVVEHVAPINDDGSFMQLDNGVYMTNDNPAVEGISPLKETLFKTVASATGFYKIDSDVWKFPIELSWHNCYSFGNGVESARIRDDYNAPIINNGVKVSATILDYGRERKSSSMIYSGLYNSTSGVNKLNEFSMAEKITKDINPSYGEIKRLKTRDTDMVVLTEDKVLRLLANKDALYSADGNPQLIASNRVLGTAVPFSGDYGISNNPESLAWDQYRLYFTDMQRGAVLRLSRDGLTPISDVHMRTWFRENLKKTNSLLGTFDMINGEYNLSLNYINNPEDNLTASFNEASKGWVSFKSFVPQTGVSIGGKYITAISKDIGSVAPKVGIWEHYIDIKKESPTASNFNEIINRNVFYATNDTLQCEGSSTNDCVDIPGIESYYQNSTIDVLFNETPSSVKAFRTIGYDGSQSRVNVFSTHDVPSNESPDNVTPLASMSDGEYTNLMSSDGWYVSNMITDLSFSAFVNEFKNKEGKWFNFIIGAERSSITKDDLSEFSVQGLGQLISVQLSSNNLVQLSIASDMVDDWDGDGAENYGGFTDGSSTEWY